MRDEVSFCMCEGIKVDEETIVKGDEEAIVAQWGSESELLKAISAGPGSIVSIQFDGVSIVSIQFDGVSVVSTRV